MTDNSLSNVYWRQIYAKIKKESQSSAILLIIKRNSKHAIAEKSSKYPRRQVFCGTVLIQTMMTYMRIIGVQHFIRIGQTH